MSNAATSGAIRDVYDETRTVLEAAGALSVAGARAYLKRHNIQAGPHHMLKFKNCNFTNIVFLTSTVLYHPLSVPLRYKDSADMRMSSNCSISPKLLASCL